MKHIYRYILYQQYCEEQNPSSNLHRSVGGKAFDKNKKNPVPVQSPAFPGNPQSIADCLCTFQEVHQYHTKPFTDSRCRCPSTGCTGAPESVCFTFVHPWQITCFQWGDSVYSALSLPWADQNILKLMPVLIIFWLITSTNGNNAILAGFCVVF